MKRPLLGLVASGLAVVIVTGAGAAAAPNATGGGVSNNPNCESEPGVTVAWLLDDDITLVRAVEIGDLPEDCSQQKIDITLRDADGNILAKHTERKSDPGASVIVDLPGAVPAALVERIDLVIGGTPKAD